MVHGEAREALALLIPTPNPSSITATLMHFQSRSILSALHPHLSTCTNACTCTHRHLHGHTCMHTLLLLQFPARFLCHLSPIGPSPDPSLPPQLASSS